MLAENETHFPKINKKINNNKHVPGPHQHTIFETELSSRILAGSRLILVFYFIVFYPNQAGASARPFQKPIVIKICKFLQAEALLSIHLGGLTQQQLIALWLIKNTR